MQERRILDSISEQKELIDPGPELKAHPHRYVDHTDYCKLFSNRLSRYTQSFQYGLPQVHRGYDQEGQSECRSVSIWALFPS